MHIITKLSVILICVVIAACTTAGYDSKGEDADTSKPVEKEDRMKPDY